MNTPQKIIQALLYEGGSMKKEDLAKFLNIKKEVVEESILEIQNLLALLGLKLIRNANSLEISLSEEMTAIINKNKIEELKSELSESALQTLAVILYKQKATKPEIDFVRGVDSGRSLKNLLTRGIIERQEEKNKKYYIPTTETLRYLNLESVQEVKDFADISTRLTELITGSKDEN
jgi:segregation and condensation protein B